MKTKKHSRLSLLPLTAVILLLAMIISCSGEKESIQPETQNSKTPPSEVHLNQSEPYQVVDVMPRFPGGEEELLKLIAHNTKYPEKAKEAGVQGRVIVRFAVTKKGAVDRVSILQGVNPDLDGEALRVISDLPDFEPGMKEGVPVDVWYAVPITFALRDSEPKPVK